MFDKNKKIVNEITDNWSFPLYVRITYMWTHPYWAGVTRISDNVPAQRMFVDITRIRSKSPALKLLCWEQKRFSTQQSYCDITYFK